MLHHTRTLALIATVAAGATAHAAVLTVDPGDPGAYATISDAVAAAVNGDDIEVVAGTYAEDVAFGGLDLTLTGLDGSAATVLEGGIDLSSSASCAITGLTIRAPGVGLLADGAMVLLDDLLLDGFGQLPTAIALELDGVTDLQATGVTVMDYAVDDPAVQVLGGTALFDHCDFLGNYGAMLADGAMVTIDGCTFEDNQAATDGGAISTINGTDLIVDHSRFYDNTAAGYGGALSLLDSSFDIGWSHFIGNEGQRGGAVAAQTPGTGSTLHHSLLLNGNANLQGGGVYIEGGEAGLLNLLIAENQAVSDAGGVRLLDCDAAVTNCSLVGNAAPLGGGLSSTGGTVTLTNLLIAFSGAGYGVSGDAAVFAAYNDVHGNPLGDYDGAVVLGAGNIDADPLLISFTPNWDALDDDYHLQTLADGFPADSPCIDAGDPSILDPDNSVSDMGAYGGTVPLEADEDEDGVSVEDGDCDDTNPDTNPLMPEICDGEDNDCDGVTPPDEIDDDGDGMTECEGDCDDTEAAVFDGNPELCDGLDNDCDTVIPADEVDNDGDGEMVCGGDCDDTNPDIFSTNPEVCDGIDNNCDGIMLIDEDVDNDGDGSPACADCHENDPDTYPGAPELCDGDDNDCDGIVPDDETDDDFDGTSECEGDCDDTDAALNSADQDDDGWTTCDVPPDCNDGIPVIHPEAPELCDGFDNDCDGVIPDVETDDDGDGFDECADDDCDDTDPMIYPGAPELCDGLDNDCDGSISPEERDDDEDGFEECGINGAPQDCDDNRADIYPGAEEICNEIDDNCDGVVDENPDCYEPDYGVSGGGGCGCSEVAETRGGGGALALLGMALLALRRFRPRRRGGRGAAALILAGALLLPALSPSPAAAQDDGEALKPAVEAHGMRTNADALGLFGVESAEVLGKFQPSFGLHFSYVKDPVVLHIEPNDTYPQDQYDYALVQTLMVLDLQGAIGFGPADIGVQLPIYFARLGEGAFDWQDLGGGGIGDLRIVPKGSFFNPGRRPYGLAFAMPMTFPLAYASSGIGDPSFRIEPTVIGELRVGPLQTAFNVGPRFRSEAMAMNAVDLTVQHEFVVRYGLALRPVDPIQFGGEIGLSAGGQGTGINPVEWFAGVKIWPGNGLRIDVGAGRGINDGYGTPDLRVMAGVTFAKEREYEPLVLLDSDGDGIADNVDQCKNQAEDKDGFEDEDGCPERDNDRDGIADVDDQCPDEPENFNTNQDDDGCPDDDPDTDGDGLADQLDPCPRDAETLNGKEDHDGCPDASLARATQDWKLIAVDKQVQFKAGKDAVDDETKPLLLSIAQILLAYPEITSLEVRSHTDDVGSEKNNLELSKRRAESVVAVLGGHGIAPERLVATGLGESAPIIPATTDEARAVNRRVEFHILAMSATPQPVTGPVEEVVEETTPEGPEGEELTEEERKAHDKMIKDAEKAKERHESDAAQTVWGEGEEGKRSDGSEGTGGDDSAGKPDGEPPVEETTPPAEETEKERKKREKAERKALKDKEKAEKKARSGAPEKESTEVTEEPAEEEKPSKEEFTEQPEEEKAEEEKDEGKDEEYDPWD